MKMNMKYLGVIFCFLFLLLSSCKEDNQQRNAENKKAAPSNDAAAFLKFRIMFFRLK